MFVKSIVHAWQYATNLTGITPGNTTISTCHHLTTSTFNRIISLMSRHLNILPGLTSEYVITCVIFMFEVLAAHHCTHTGVVIYLTQFITVCVVVVVLVYYVKCCTTFILFTCLEYISLNLNTGSFILILLFHKVPSILFTLKTFLSKII